VAYRDKRLRTFKFENSKVMVMGSMVVLLETYECNSGMKDAAEHSESGEAVVLSYHTYN